MFVRVVITIGLIASAGVAAAQENAPAQPAAEKKICRSVVPTGSIMAKRICLTKSEWARLNDVNDMHADLVKEARRRAIDTRAMGDRE